MTYFLDFFLAEERKYFDLFIVSKWYETRRIGLPDFFFFFTEHYPWYIFRTYVLTNFWLDFSRKLSIDCINFMTASTKIGLPESFFLFPWCVNVFFWQVFREKKVIYSCSAYFPNSLIVVLWVTLIKVYDHQKKISIWIHFTIPKFSYITPSSSHGLSNQFSLFTWQILLFQKFLMRNC